MPTLTFSQLVDKYGEVVALATLVEIERAANLLPQHRIVDPEARLAHACFLQDRQMALAA